MERYFESMNNFKLSYIFDVYINIFIEMLVYYQNVRKFERKVY